MRITIPSTALMLGLLSLISCDSAPPKKAATTPVISTTKTVAQSAPATAAPITYTWNTMRAGPGCLRQLRQLMDWYATQAETIKQFDFTPGATTDGPMPSGPYSVDMGMVDAYLALLHKAGYFSTSYLEGLRKSAHSQEISLQYKQPAADTAPAIPGLPLFALNYDGMLEQREHFTFEVDQRNRTIVFNDGTGIQGFTFDKNCKLQVAEWLGYAPE